MQAKPDYPCWISNEIKANERCFTLVSAIAVCWQIKFRHVRCVWFGENWQQLVKSTANRRVDGSMVSLPQTGSQSMKRPYRRASGNQHMFGAIWDVEQINFLHVSQIFQRCKKRGKVKFDLSSPINPKTIGIFTKVFCTIVPNCWF